MSGLPEGWAQVPLSELGQWASGGTPSRGTSSYYGPGTPWVKTGDLRDAVLFEVPESITPDGIANSAAKIFPAGTLLVAMYGATIGRTAVLGVPAATNQACAALLAHGTTADLIPYAWWFLRSKTDALKEAGQGGAQPNISQEILKALPIEVPPLAEQRRIVAKLDALTARTARARADLNRIPALAARYKQAVLARAFSGELTASWRHAKGLAAPWPAKLADLVAAPVRNGLSVRGSDEPPGVRAVRLSALRGRSVNLNDVRFLPISEDRASRFLLQQGDILVSRGNGTKALVGISALVPDVREPTIFPDTAFRLRLARDRVEPQWLSFVWSAPQVRAQIESVAKTTAGIWKVSQGDLAGIELLLFERAEQVEIVRRVDHALAEIDRMTAEATAASRLLDRLDQAVLAKAFRGELVPQDPADEPASALLDRIRAERAAAPKAKRGRKAAA